MSILTASCDLAFCSRSGPPLRASRQASVSALFPQQGLFPLQPIGIAAEPPIATHDPVAWDEYREMVIPAGCSRRPNGAWLAHRGSDLRIAAPFTRRNSSEERSVGKECVRRFGSVWSTYH